VKYWDSSAIVPLLVSEAATDRSGNLLTADPQIITWWLSRIECASALNRLRRDGELSEVGLRTSLKDLEILAKSWVEVQPVDAVRLAALRLLRLHPLRAADALQLASAVVAAGEDRSQLPFITFDGRLLEAADREGFSTIGLIEA